MATTTDRRDARASTFRRGAAWAARVVVAAALVTAAWWWKSHLNWAGLTYCEIHKKDFCDGSGFEAVVPFFLWTTTFFGSLFVCVAGASAAPSSSRERIAWAAILGSSILVANSNNLWWAIPVTAVSMWLIAGIGRRPAGSEQRWPQPGWYRRPGSFGDVLRWWDGERWTSQRAAPPRW